MAYVIFTESSFSKRNAFMLLEDLREVTNRVGIASPTSLSMALKEKVTYYNTHPEVDKLAAARRNIEEVNSIMLQNIEKVLERGTKIEILMDKTELMEERAVAFKKTAVKVKRHFWWLNLKMKLACGFVLLVVLLIVIDVIICKGTVCFSFA
jgi:vesicle-associated membrane protein 7